MYKRRDWLFTHGADGGGSDSSSDDDSSTEAGSGSEEDTGSSGSEPEQEAVQGGESGEESSGDEAEQQESEEEDDREDEEQPATRLNSKSRTAAAAAAAAAPAAAAAAGRGGSDSEDGVSGGASPLPLRRLEDLSEDEFSGASDGEAHEKLLQLGALLSNWTDAPEEEWVKGRAVKCRVCQGRLILNATAFRQHNSSKKHAKQLARAEAAEQPRRVPAFRL